MVFKVKVTMHITEHERQSGITPRLKTATKQIKCPRCGHSFNLFQSRAIACKGCRHAALGCEKARCLHCDFEFPLNGPFVPSDQGQRNLSTYMNAIIDNYYKSVGKKPSR